MNRTWLSHHGDEELGRCVVLFGVPLCARCLGIWPAVLLVAALEARVPISLAPSAGLALELALCLPALWDIQRGVVDPTSGSNAFRVVSGIALGVALGHAASVGQRGGFAQGEALWPLALCAAFGAWALVSRNPEG